MNVSRRYESVSEGISVDSVGIEHFETLRVLFGAKSMTAINHEIPRWSIFQIF